MSTVNFTLRSLALILCLSGCATVGGGVEVVGNLGEEEFLRMRAGQVLAIRSSSACLRERPSCGRIA